MTVEVPRIRVILESTWKSVRLSSTLPVIGLCLDWNASLQNQERPLVFNDGRHGRHREFSEIHGSRPGAGTYRRMLLNGVDTGLGSFVAELGPPESPPWGGSPTTSVFKVLEMALAAEQVELPPQSNVRHYR